MGLEKAAGGSDRGGSGMELHWLDRLTRQVRRCFGPICSAKPQTLHTSVRNLDFKQAWKVRGGLRVLQIARQNHRSTVCLFQVILENLKAGIFNLGYTLESPGSGNWHLEIPIPRSHRRPITSESLGVWCQQFESFPGGPLCSQSGELWSKGRQGHS